MEGYGKYGIKTIWIDAAEPERMDDKNVGNWKYMVGTDAEVGGAWVQQHTRMIADGMKTIGIEPEDYFILPRHAWLAPGRTRQRCGAEILSPHSTSLRCR